MLKQTLQIVLKIMFYVMSSKCLNGGIYQEKNVSLYTFSFLFTPTHKHLLYEVIYYVFLLF